MCRPDMRLSKLVWHVSFWFMAWSMRFERVARWLWARSNRMEHDERHYL